LKIVNRVFFFFIVYLNIVDAGAGYDNYLWSANAYVSRNRTVTVTNTGFYTVIVQSQGCVAESDKFEVIGMFILCYFPFYLFIF